MENDACAECEPRILKGDSFSALTLNLNQQVEINEGFLCPIQKCCMKTCNKNRRIISTNNTYRYLSATLTLKRVFNLKSNESQEEDLFFVSKRKQGPHQCDCGNTNLFV